MDHAGGIKLRHFARKPCESCVYRGYGKFYLTYYFAICYSNHALTVNTTVQAERNFTMVTTGKILVRGMTKDGDEFRFCLLHGISLPMRRHGEMGRKSRLYSLVRAANDAAFPLRANNR